MKTALHVAAESAFRTSHRVLSGARAGIIDELGVRGLLFIRDDANVPLNVRRIATSALDVLGRVHPDLLRRADDCRPSDSEPRTA